MNNLELVKSVNFGKVQADIYSNGNEFCMTTEQLGECLGHSQPKSSIGKLVSRNQYLKNKEFSGVVAVETPQGGKQDTRVFTEDGIYEVSMLAKTEKAKDFRAWIRAILKSLRTGKAKIISMTDYQRMMAETRTKNTRIRAAQILTKLAEQYDGTYKQVLNSYATKELTGEHLLPLPQLPNKTYTATELGELLGVSANKIGILTNQNGLKIDQYGAWFNDKAKGHNKEVQSFRYYESVIPVLRDLLKSKSA